MDKGFAKMGKLIAELSERVAGIRGKEIADDSSVKTSADEDDVDESE